METTVATSLKSNGISAFLSGEKISLIKQMYCKKATDLELQHFLEVCQSKQLDPTLKQIHAVFRWSKKENRDIMSIQVGIDGFRAIADRTGKYAGNDQAELIYDNGKFIRARFTVYKMVEGVRCPFVGEAKWTEYYPGSGSPQAFFWDKMPEGQLIKCAEAIALRRGFPHQLSGIYVDEEMHQAEVEIPEKKASPQIPTIVKVLNTPKIDSFARDTAQNIFPIEGQASAFDNSMAGYINEKQIKELFGIAKACKWEVTELKTFLKDKFNVTETAKIEVLIYDDVLDAIRQHRK